MIRAIIFDFFDVFRTDSYKAWLAAKNIPREGAYYDVAYQQDIGAITLEQFYERLSELTGRKVTPEEIDATATVDQQVVAIARNLQSVYRLALLSNAPSAFLRGILEDHDLEKYFSEIIISSEVGLVKPSVEIFELALEKLGTTADETLFIDDNPKNTKAAESIGIRSIVFTSAEQLQQDLAGLGIAAELS